MSTRHRSIPRAYWSVALLVSLTACAKWQVQTVTPQTLLSERHPYRVRITRADDAPVVLYAPEVRGDTLYGTTHASKGASVESMAVPLSGIRQVAIRRVDPVATGALALGSAAVAAGAVMAALLASMPAD